MYPTDVRIVRLIESADSKPVHRLNRPLVFPAMFLRMAIGENQVCGFVVPTCEEFVEPPFPRGRRANKEEPIIDAILVFVQEEENMGGAYRVEISRLVEMMNSRVKARALSNRLNHRVAAGTRMVPSPFDRPDRIRSIRGTFKNSGAFYIGGKLTESSVR